MNIEEFVSILEQRQLVSASIVKQVREKISRGDRRITSRSLLKYLVKKDLLTRSQAKQLLQTTLTVSPSAESSILGMVALPDAPTDESFRSPPEKAPQEEVIPTLAPVDSASDSKITKEARESAIREEELASISGFVSAVLPDAGSEEADVDDDKKSRKKKRKGHKRREQRHEFDTPLLLLGGGGLIVLLLAGGIIYYLLSREDADAILAEAGEFYDGGSYTQAVNQYDRFVTDFPGHPEFSTANVRLGLAKILKSTSGTSQFSEALEVTKQVLDDIEDEKEFESAKRELSAMLPAIAQGLASQAEEAAESEEISKYVAQSKEALALCNNTKFVPSTFRDDVVLNEILETLDRVERGQEQSVDLAQALTDIQAAIDGQDTAQAYAIHKGLIRKHPGLLNNQSLAEQIQAISAAEMGGVRFSTESRDAETTPRPSPVVAHLALAGRQGPVAELEGTVPVRIDGAVYALNASDGKLLWRTFVGFGANLPPVVLANGDFLVVDTLHHELLRLRAETGKLVWRHPFEGPILSPVVHKGRLLVTEQSGKLHVLESSNGQSLGYVQFEQPLPVPPVVARKGHRIYVVGDHSSVYTLSSDDYSCLGVFFLGHAPGSVVVSPVMVLNKVVVAENSGVETCYLHALGTTAEGQIAAIDASRRLEGLVNTPLLVDGRRLVALTTMGQVAVYEVGAGGGEQSLDQIAIREPESALPVARFGLLHQGHVWSAGTQLNKLAILPTGNRLPVRDIDFDYGGDTFDYSLQLFSDVLIHVRRPQDQAGAIVAAMNTSSGNALWETELAVPLAGAPAVDSDNARISAVTASGAAYVFDREAMGKRVQDKAQRLRSGPTLTPLVESADLKQGRLALASAGANFILQFRPNAPSNPLTSIPLPAPLSCPPVAWENDFVAATQIGQVYLYNGDTAEQIGSPFQPALAADEEFNWLTPAVYGIGKDSRLVLSDGTANIYLLRRVDQPRPNLQAEAEAKLGGSPLNTRLAVVGESVFAGARNNKLERFSLPELKRQPATDLKARIVWGPFAVGGQLLLTTALDELVSIDEEGSIAWSKPLTHGQPNGKPFAEDGTATIVWQQGGMSRILIKDGTEDAYLQLDQPTVAGPLALGGRLILVSSDGTLLVVNRP